MGKEGRGMKLFYSQKKRENFVYHTISCVIYSYTNYINYKYNYK